MDITERFQLTRLWAALGMILCFGVFDIKAKAADTTKVGVYITSIYDLDYSNSSFTVEYWLWRLNKNREFKEYYIFNPIETKTEEKPAECP